MANAFVDGFLNTMLDAGAAILDEVSLHTAFSTSGANEVTGGSYARQAITWNAAAAGALDSSNAPSFSVPGTNTIRFVGFYDTIPSPDVFQGMIPNQQAGDIAPQRFIVEVTTNAIQAPAHGFANDDNVVFIGGTPPAPLVEGTVYWIVASATDEFDVSATQGGAAIDLTTQGDQDVRFWQIREETFASDGTYNLNDVDLDFLT
jgi:hypothetical protein